MTNTIATNRLQRLINKKSKNDIDLLKEMTKLSKLKIKVIKKEAVETYKTPVVMEKKLTRRKSCQIASNVSGWVNEFQHRRSEESKQAFSRLLTLRG